MPTIRKFFSDQVAFTVSTVPNSQVDNNVVAYIYLNGSATVWNVLALTGGQISEEEYSPGLFRYNISNYEIPANTTSVAVEWQGSVSGVPADNSPISTAPSIDQQVVGDYLEVASSTPTAGASSVDPRITILLNFDEDLDETSLVSKQIFIQPAGSTNYSPVRAYVNPSDLSQLVVEPVNKLGDSITYELVVPKLALYGSSGARLEKDFRLKFKTGADSIQSLHQATDEGVVERAGPLKIYSGTAPSSGPALSSSTPANNACNYPDQQLTFIFSEAIDPYNSIPVLTIGVTPLFDTTRYYVNDALWGDANNDPDFPTGVIEGGEVAARGTIVFDSNPLDGETLVISDGVMSAVTFEFDDNASVGGGNTAVAIGATSADTLANFIIALNAAGFALTVVDNTLLTGTPQVLIVSGVPGAGGNSAIGGTHASLTVTGISGGVDSTGTAPFTSVAISGNQLIVTLNQAPPGNAYVNVQVTGLVTLADPTTALPDVDITYISELWPMRVSVGEIRRVIRRYLAEDLTDCDLAVLITQIGLDYYDIYESQALTLQTCPISSEVALILMDDYIADSGLDGSKELGPFRVQTNSKAFMSGPYKRMTDQLDKCLFRLNAFFTGPRVGIRSSQSALERPTGRWRIRTWNRADGSPIYLDENKYLNRQDKIPGADQSWS